MCSVKYTSCPQHCRAGQDSTASTALSFPNFLADSVEDEFELSTVCHRPEGLEQLQEQTKFTRKELQVLYRGFKNVSSPHSFSAAMHPLGILLRPVVTL